MERNTKILLGVGAAVLAFFIFRSSKAKASPIESGNEGPSIGQCPEGEVEFSFKVYNKDRSTTIMTKCKRSTFPDGSQTLVKLNPEDCPKGTRYTAPVLPYGLRGNRSTYDSSPLCVSEVLDPVDPVEITSAYPPEMTKVIPN